MIFKIQTPRLLIIPLEEEDFPLALDMMQNPQVMRYIGKGVKTEEEARTLFDLFIDHQKTFGFCLGKVFERSTGDFIGLGGIIHFALNHDDPTIEVGYWLNPPYWGKGYAPEIAKYCVDWAFEHLKIDKVVGVTHLENAASQRVLQKAGLVPNGNTHYRGTEVKLFTRKAPEKIDIFNTPPDDFDPQVEVGANYLLCQGEILLLKRALGKPEEALWGVPAGKIDQGETALQGAMRELTEETGITLPASQFTEKGRLFVRKDSVDYIYHMYVVHLDQKPDVKITDEHLEYQWIAPADACTLPLMSGADTALEAAGVF